MQNSNKRFGWRLIAVMATMAMLVAACGGDSETTTTAGDGDTTAPPADAAAFDEYDLSGITVSVGSKNFDEQIILGHLLKEAFEYAGADVEDNINLGGTNLAREAMLNGDIDTYVEYNGTGYAVHLAIQDPIPFDPDELTQIVREGDLEENDIQWLSQAPFNNTYGFVSSPAVTEANGGGFDFQSMADYLEANPDANLCLESEFPNRDDGLVLFEDHTGYDVPDSQIEIADVGLIYTETSQNNCDFGEVFTTDGRIPALELTLVEDPNVMILYNVSVNMRDDKYQEAPDAFDGIAEGILSGLTQERMTELNRLVSFEGEDPAAVARQYLIDEGLISG
ncbi:MAG: glycine betaine ABC transporter substrate-binding protein [Acidimicrobiia bacterium]